MRAYTTTLNATCDRCGTTDSGAVEATSAQESATLAIKVMRYRGWKVSRQGRGHADLCPDCAPPLPLCVDCGTPTPVEYAGHPHFSGGAHTCERCARRRWEKGLDAEGCRRGLIEEDPDA